MSLDNAVTRITDALERIASALELSNNQPTTTLVVPAVAEPQARRGRPRKTDAPVDLPAPATPAQEPAAPTPPYDITIQSSDGIITLDTVKQRLADITQDNPGSIEQIRSVLSTMGVARVSELDPADYESFLTRLDGLL